MRKTLDVPDVLHVERPVEAALVADEGDALGVAPFPASATAGSPGTSLSIEKVMRVTPNSTRMSCSSRLMI